MCALKRIRKELIEINKSTEILPFSAWPVNESDMFHWQADILGPKDTPYYSGVFFLNIHFSIDHPFRTPKVRFTNRIFHVNIHGDGSICCETFKILHSEWSPALTIKKVLIEIVNLLKYPDFENCNLFGYDERLRRCYLNRDYEYYNEIAKEWAKKYAWAENNNYSIEEEKNLCDEINTKLINYENELIKLDPLLEKIKNEVKKQIKELKSTLDKKKYKNILILKEALDQLKMEENKINELKLNMQLPLKIKETKIILTFVSFDENIHFSIMCEENELFSKIEELLYEKYPDYNHQNNYFTLGGNRISKNNSLKDNNIKDNDIIVLNMI